MPAADSEGSRQHACFVFILFTFKSGAYRNHSDYRRKPCAVTLTLMRGNAQVGAAQTVQMSDSAPYTGAYDFTDIPAGTYNIVAVQGGLLVLKEK